MNSDKITQEATLGSVSTGTLKSKDLFEAFIGLLESLNDERADQLKSEWLYELTDALSEYAPPYTYFGAHPGDGADFGFWPYQEEIDDAIHDGTLVPISDSSEIVPGKLDKYDNPVCGFVLVNDHGNMTMFDAAGEVIWDVV